MNVFAFIDASNLFYGGKKSLGWRIDYDKLFGYLKNKYKVSNVLYFGGVETHGFRFNYLKNETVSMENLKTYLLNLKNDESNNFEEIEKSLKKVKFYLKLNSFGYKLFLKPVKIYKQEGGIIKKKANCDVDMTFYLMKEQDNFDKALILSGDGDFLPVLKYLREQDKEIVIMSRGDRTAKEIKQFAGSDFRSFEYLRNIIMME